MIGHPLDAFVTLSLKKSLYDILLPYESDLRSIFIVSGFKLLMEETLTDAYECTEIEGAAILVQSASGEKCERCWTRSDSVGSLETHPTICDRCAGVIAKL